MSFAGFMFRARCSRRDAKRDAKLKEPSDVTAKKDINYAGNSDRYNLLDIYYPKTAQGKLPVIVSVHGGGYVYGTKEIYKYYGMYLAGQGFVFVNFNYHLAPKQKFPGQLKEAVMVLFWMTEHADEYHMDLNNVFMVGDSVGAQMASQLAAIYSNKAYASLFPFQIPPQIKLRAIALNCGLYELGVPKDGKKVQGEAAMLGGLMRDYLGAAPERFGEMLDVKGHITGAFPPAYIMTAHYDILKKKAKPMYDLLRELGVEAQYKCYGSKETKYMAHVCHVNMNLEEAQQINRDECAFFRRFLTRQVSVL